MTDLKFERATAVLPKLLCFCANRFRRQVNAESADQFNLLPIRSTEEAKDRDVIEFPQRIVYRDLDTGFGDRVAVTSRLEFSDNGAGIFEIHTDEPRREILAHHDVHGFQGLVGIAGAALSGFAPTRNAIIGFDSDDQRAAVFEKAGGTAVDFLTGRISG